MTSERRLSSTAQEFFDWIDAKTRGRLRPIVQLGIQFKTEFKEKLSACWNSRRRIFFYTVVIGALGLPPICYFSKGVTVALQAMTAVGTVGVTLMALFSDWIGIYVFPPPLRLKVGRASHPWQRPLNKDGRLVPTFPARKVWWFGLEVRNKRWWRPAKNCDVVLRDMYRLGQDGSLEREPMTIDVPFVWGTVPDSPPRLTVGSERQRVNLCALRRLSAGEAILRGEDPRLAMKGPLISLALQAYVFTFRSTIRPHETAYLSVVIRADNLPAQDCQVFKIRWDGIPTDDESEIWQHVKIRRLKREDLEELAKRFDPPAPG